MLFITKGGGGGVATSQGGTVWNPGAAPGDGYVTTWAEVMTAFAEVPTGQFVVYFDDAGGGTFDIPAGTYELDSRLAFARPAPAVGQLTVSLADGAILRNLAGVYRNITLETNATATTALQFNDGHAAEFDLGAVLDNRGTQPAIVVAAGETIALGFYRASRAEATTAAIVDLEAGATLTATFQSGSQASTDWVSGDVTATLTYLADSTYNEVTLSAAPGTVTTTRTASYANLGGTPTADESLWFSPADAALAAAPAFNAGSWSVGAALRWHRAATCSGVRFYWPGGVGAQTVRCKLWRTGLGALASIDVAVNAAGVYLGTFAAPVAVLPTATATLYYVSVWDLGTRYVRWNGNPQNWPAAAAPGARSLTWPDGAPRGFAAGDAMPTGAGVEYFPVEPVFAVP